jgi:hypothetical protein
MRLNQNVRDTVREFSHMGGDGEDPDVAVHALYHDLG